MADDAVVAAMHDVDFLEEGNIALVESSVDKQATDGSYHARANRGLLKLYQQFPGRRSSRHTELVLVKALAALPDPDFLLAMYLIPDALHASESVATLIELERLLQTAQFRAFWVAAKAPATRSLLGRVAGFDSAVREFVARVIARTYQKIESVALAASLDLDDVTEFATAHGWTLEGGVATLPLVAENTPRARKTGEDSATTIKYSDVAPLVSMLARQ